MLKPKNISPAVIISYLIVYIVWGATYFFIRMAVESMPPFYVVGIRFFCAGLIFLLIAIATGRLKTIPTPHELLTAFLMGFFLLFMGNGMVSVAEKSVESYLAALTIAATPFCVAFFNRIIFKEKLSAVRLIGMTIGIIGVALILYNGKNILGSFTPGIILVLIGLTSWSAATSVGHKIHVHKDNLVNSGLQMAFAGATALILSQFIYEPITQMAPQVSLRSWIGTAFLTIFGGAAFFCYSYLIKKEPSIRVVSYAIVNPLIAVALGILFGGEHAGSLLLVGLPLILAGLVFMLYGGEIVRRFSSRSLNPLP